VAARPIAVLFDKPISCRIKAFNQGERGLDIFCEPFSWIGHGLCDPCGAETPWERALFFVTLLCMWFGFIGKSGFCSQGVFISGLFALCLLGACGVAPVQWSGSPKIVEPIPYAGPHGKPRAYGGGVCAIKSVHSHYWPPVPKGAFQETPDGYRDQRALYGYLSAHSHYEGSCFREGWHMHLEPPLASLFWSSRDLAFTESQDHTELLEVFTGSHGPRRCAKGPCTFSRRHGHRPCP
jgi:hypothetical protein